MDNLSDSEKKRVAGQCNFGCLSLVATAAIICGIYGNSDCNFASRTLSYAEGVDSSSICTSLFGTSNSVCEAIVQPHGIGFYAWYGTVPVDQEVCLSYTQYVPGVGYVTPGFDTKFNSAKALGITASVFGFMAWFTLMMASCCPISQQRLKGLSCYFFLATLFEGLTFLLWRSNSCKLGFFSAYFPIEDDAILEDISTLVTDVNCGLATGSKLALSATVLYFWCTCLIPGAVAPKPMGYEQMMAEQQQQEAATGGGDAEAGSSDDQ